MQDTPLDGDPLVGWADQELQRHAARMTQEAFALAFRASIGETGIDLGEVKSRLANWVRAGASDEARALRLALAVAGLDQWGLAYSGAFGLAAIPALSELVGDLRTAQDERADARFLQMFATLTDTELAAIDFKIDLRRAIHLALWHAMIACEERDEAMRILGQLGSLLLAQTRAMPQHGWRLVADALAHIQIRCLADGLASEGLAQETNQALFNSLAQALPKDQWEMMLAHATQSLLAWQRARRADAAQ